MKKFILFTMLCILTISVFAQSNNNDTKSKLRYCLPFEKANEIGITDKALSKEYISRHKIRLDGRKSRKKLYKDQVDMWLGFWEAFDEKFAYKELPIELVHKFYFDEKGNIIYFLYNIFYTKEGVSINEEELNKNLKAHLETFDFGILVEKKWSQCGTWTY